MMSRDASQRVYPNIGIAEPHHSMSHHGNNPEKIANLVKLNTYHMSLFAKFLKKLKRHAGRRRLAARSFADPLRQRHERERHRTRASTSRRPSSAAARACVKGNRHIQAPKETPLANLMLDFAQQVRLRDRQVRHAQHGPRRGLEAMRTRRTSRTRGSESYDCGSGRCAYALSLRVRLAAGVPSSARPAGAACASSTRSKQGNCAAVKALIAQKADVNAAEADGMTALHWAVRANDAADGAAADPRGRQRQRRQPLRHDADFLAAQNGDPPSSRRCSRPAPTRTRAAGGRNGPDDGGPHRQRRQHQAARRDAARRSTPGSSGRGRPR